MDLQILIPVTIIGVLGLGFGLILAYVSKRFDVPVDPRVEQVRKILPGANCGACGYSGCDAYAVAVVYGQAAPTLCTVGGDPVAREMGAIMGVTVQDKGAKKARVLCKGTPERSRRKYGYEGIESCAAASLLYGGSMECPYGCLGIGDCVKACQFGAIRVVDGVAFIDEEKCTACAMCVASCPKGIIRMVKQGVAATTRCSNRDKGAVA
ncbi:MAG TPA: ferredoxin, partial [Clostridiales bacterium]|nr:ferredoxin [Clostridiales bacterium]